METGTTIRLSFLARRKRLPVLPEQPSGTAFGIVWDACPIPQGFVCYVVQFIERSRAKIMGLVSGDGRVYRALAPSDDVPADEDACLILVRERGNRVGDVYVKSDNGRLVHTSAFRGSTAGTMREVAEEATWNTEHSLVYREFMATMFLRHCVFHAPAVHVPATDDAGEATVPRTEQLAAPVEIFKGFREALLTDAISALLFRIERNEHPSGIEKFAHSLFSEIDLARLRTLVTVGEVSLAHIENMDGFYINLNREAMSPEDVVFLYGVESRLNRVLAVLKRIGVGLSPASTSPSEEACSLLDRMGFEEVTSHVGRLIREGDHAPRCSWNAPGTVACQPGGEWDVRMHVAELCEGLNLLVRLEYRFDYCEESHRIALQFTKISATSMPSSLYDEESSSWIDVDDGARERAAAEYGCRIVMVLAAAAFAASPTISNCLVEEHDPIGQTYRSFAFNRTAFMVDLLPKALELVGVPLATGGAASALRASETSERFRRIAAPERTAAPRDDARRLPEALRDLLHADFARELEVVEDKDDEFVMRFAQLQGEGPLDPAQAEAKLGAFIDEMQAACAVAELEEDRPVRTQFCENHLGRILLPLFIDDPSVRVLRAPDALFFAQYELCSVYLNCGAVEQAILEARRLLDMATTSMQAHFTLISVLARQKMFDEVIDVAKHGLRAAYDRDAIAYLFYRLAFAYWNEGDKLTALACYRLVPAGEQIAAVAQEEAHELMNRMGLAEPLGFAEAVTIAKAAGVPIPPTDELYNQVADAAVQLMDAGFLYLAARCVYAMWRMYGKDELGVISRSLLFD